MTTKQVGEAWLAMDPSALDELQALLQIHVRDRVGKEIEEVASRDTPAIQLVRLCRGAARAAFEADFWPRELPCAPVRIEGGAELEEYFVDAIRRSAERFLQLDAWTVAASQRWDSMGQEAHDRVIALAAEDLPLVNWAGFSGSPHLVGRNYARWRRDRWAAALLPPSSGDFSPGERKLSYSIYARSLEQIPAELIVPCLWRWMGENETSRDLPHEQRREATNAEEQYIEELLHRLRVRCATETTAALPDQSSPANLSSQNPEGWPQEWPPKDELQTAAECARLAGIPTEGRQKVYAPLKADGIIKRWFTPAGVPQETPGNAPKGVEVLYHWPTVSPLLARITARRPKTRPS